MGTALVLLLGGLLGTLHVLAANQDRRRTALFLKPLPVALCIAWILAGSPRLEPDGYWIVLGLTWSALGDLLLGLPRERFLEGLGAFLIAHLCYARSFFLRDMPTGNLWLLGFLLIYSTLVWRAILPGVGRLKGPVLIYLSAIATMVWLAGESWLHLPGHASRGAFTGAMAFMISDSLLAYDRFVRPLPWRKALVMGSYYLAQFLIAGSCLW